MIDVLTELLGRKVIEVAGIGLGGVEIVLGLLALVGVWVGGRIVLAWVQSMILRLAVHHLVLGGLGALGIGIETFVDGGIVAFVTDLLPLLALL